MSMHDLNIADRSRKLSQAVAGIGFFLLFPGFLFYHQFVAMGLIPPFAAGFFGYVSLGVLLTLMALLPWRAGRLRHVAGNRYARWTLAFLLYTLCWTLAHYIVLDGDYITKASRQSLETIIFWSCLFLIGLLLPLQAGALRVAFFLSFVVVLGFLLHFFISAGDTVYHAQRIYSDAEGVSTYQGFARSAMITLLLLLAVFRSFRARMLVILGGVFILYLLISRSDFYAFLALSAALCLIWGLKQPRYFLLLLLLTLELSVLAAPDILPRAGVLLESMSPDKTVEAPMSGTADAASMPDGTDALPRLSRQFEVLDFSSSKSWASRLSLQKIALTQIAGNPLMGQFGGHILREDSGKHAKGHRGRYAHNALSAWVTYGLVGFILYVSLTLCGFLIAARRVVLQQQDAPVWLLAFMVTFVCLLLSIVSKSVYWPLPALGWGLVTQSLLNPASKPD